MTRAKIIFIYISLGTFVAVAMTGILGAFGIIPIDALGASLALIAPCLGIVVAAVKAKHLFDDPDAITELKNKHADEIIDMKKGFAEREADIQKKQSDREAQIRNEHSIVTQQLKTRIKQLESEIAKKDVQIRGCQDKISAFMTKDTIRPVSGH